MKELLERITKVMTAEPLTVSVKEDLYGICNEVLKTDEKTAVKYLKILCNNCETVIPDMVRRDLASAQKTMGLHRNGLLTAAPFDFDSFIQYTEWDREPRKQFYIPRKRVLRPIARELQRLADGDLELLAISMPPGSGKTTLAIFFLTWLAGKYPDEPILTGSHSNSFVRGVYDECLRMVDPKGEYLWHDVFPNVPMVNTNAKDCRIDFGKRKRFETLEFTSIGTGNAGLYRASRLLYCDDLVSGIEVALSKERLDKLWETYTTDLRQRKIGDHCGELHIATRWSVHDCIGRLERQYENDPKAKFVVCPAMDENDESNFDYDYGIGFTTKFYREQREIMDDVSWKALYMNQPIEREGLLCTREELRRYFELPDKEPDAILAVCDTKDKGTDYCSMPVMYQYGEDFYMDAVVLDNSNPEIVEAQLVSMMLERKIQMAQFESNAAGGRVAEKVQNEVKSRGGITRITTKYTTANKETKIIVNSPWWKQHVLFKDDSVIESDKQYRKFLDMVCGYTMAGKNKNDDTVDSLAEFALFAQSLTGAKVQVINRPW